MRQTTPETDPVAMLLAGAAVFLAFTMLAVIVASLFRFSV